MAVTSRDLRNSPSQRIIGQHRSNTGQLRVVNNPARSTGQLRPVNTATRNTGPLSLASAAPDTQPRRSVTIPHLITTLLVLVALALIGNSVVSWAQIKLDDYRYGRPRITTLSSFVGHNEAGGTPTQFIAMNLNRRVVVLQVPGGDPAQTRTLTGPYLFGVNEDLTPVHLRLGLVNGDNELDLIVSVKNEEIIYINENGSYRLITPEERAAYQQQAPDQNSIELSSSQ